MTMVLGDGWASARQQCTVQAVVRGLQEELGICTDVSQIRGPLTPCHQRTLLIPGVVHDVEFVSSYRSSASAP